MKITAIKTYLISFLASIVLLFLFLVPFAFTDSKEDGDYPRLANYYLKWKITDNEAVELAKWDVLVLDMELQVSSQRQLKKIREINPDAKILAYVTSQEIKDSLSGSLMRRKLAVGLSDGWYLKNSSGKTFSFWPGTKMLNPTKDCPFYKGQRWSDHLAYFVKDEILDSGLWDGVFYDNAWGSMTWFTGLDVDLNLDRRQDYNLDKKWQEGMKYLFSQTKKLAGDDFIIVGNSITTEYAGDYNGLMMENFSKQKWEDVMWAYKQNTADVLIPNINIINNNTGNNGYQDYQNFRYGLASTLLLDGYYSFDWGDQSHEQLWWYDEYDTDLGAPVGGAISLAGYDNFKSDVWKREYENGLAVVNTTSKLQRVDLGGEYEKISGFQDSTFNDGSIVSRLTLDAKDGAVMMKTYETLADVFFGNGDFVRFYEDDGERSRNGFFVFENEYDAGVQIYKGDIDGDKKEEKILLSGNKLEIYNDTGGRWHKGYPFGGGFQGRINLAVGDLEKDGKDEIILTNDETGQVLVYSYFGKVLESSLYPLGKNFTGGFNVAIGDVDGGGHNEVILSAGGRGYGGRVLVYGYNFRTLKKDFYPFGWLGKNIASTVGYITNSKTEQMVFLSGTQAYVFDYNLKKISDFKIETGFFGSSLYLDSLDVDFDGLDEILVFSRI